MNRKIKNLIHRIPQIEIDILEAFSMIKQANRDLNMIKNVLKNDGGEENAVRQEEKEEMS